MSVKRSTLIAERLLLQQRIMCALARGPMTTIELEWAMRDLKAQRVACNARALLEQGRIEAEVVIRSKGRSARKRPVMLWALPGMLPRARRREDEKVGVTSADHAWMAYWQLTKAERRANPAPDYSPLSLHRDVHQP